MWCISSGCNSLDLWIIVSAWECFYARYRVSVWWLWFICGQKCWHNTIWMRSSHSVNTEGSNQKSTTKNGSNNRKPKQWFIHTHTPIIVKPIIIAIKSFCLVIEREIAAYKNQFKFWSATKRRRRRRRANQQATIKANSFFNNGKLHSFQHIWLSHWLKCNDKKVHIQRKRWA